MEKNNWITNILNSTNGIKSVEPSDDLFSKIQQRIQKEHKVSSKTVWLVAASITVLLLLNFSAIISKNKDKNSSTTTYLEMTVNKSNQLYQ
jgi:prophage maintenance system killer protein